MKSPRFGEHKIRHGKPTLGWVVALAAMLIAVPCRAQSTGAPPVAGAAPPDSPARQGTDTTRPPASAATPLAPVDSALSAACAEAVGPPDVLLVKFQPAATESERLAVAKQVGGVLLGMSQHVSPGSWYLRVPGSAADPAVADRLILLAPVLEVGSTRCPA